MSPHPSRLRRSLLTLAVTGAAALAVAPTAVAASPPPGLQLFAPDSIWNLPLRADAPVSPDSAGYVGWLTATVAATGTWINSTSCGMPTYWAEPDTPTVAVRLDHPSYMDPALIRAWSAVPIPAGARPANCSDRNFAIAQPQPDGTVTLWELWAATQAADGSWTAKWGGVTQDVARDRGVASALQWRDSTATSFAAREASPHWNVTASSISQSAGVITMAELQAGRIPHALAIATPDAAAGIWMWPAQRSDGALQEAYALPEGAQLRLDPSLDLDTLGLPPLARMMAEAAQRYGVVLRDRTWDRTVFYTEEPQPGQVNPLPGLLGGVSPGAVLARFPWNRLQLLDRPLCTTTCTLPDQARLSVDATDPRVGDDVRLDTSNSALDQPRAAVRWDLDGDGSYETDGGTDVARTWTPAAAGPQRVGVQITTRAGAVTTATADVTVAPLVTTVLKPASASSTEFYRWSGGDTTLGALTSNTAPPSVPSGDHQLYSGSVSGKVTIGFAPSGATRPSVASVDAYVRCATRMCARLVVLDASGAVVAQATPAFGTSGWVSISVPGRLTPEQADGLRLRASTAWPAAGAAGTTSLSAVRLTLAN